jgi:hypothetical protein
MHSGPDESPDQKFQNHLFGAAIRNTQRKLRRRHPEMSDAPFAAVGIAHPQRGLVAMNLAQDGLDLVATRVEIGRMCTTGCALRGSWSARATCEPEPAIRANPSGVELLAIHSDSEPQPSSSKIPISRLSTGHSRNTP